ncbi:hypothetical protein N180_06875 [Pedobacter antarcticus 4BY]|uniref:Glycosyl transferase family 11 n=2 Tax=Pedobacter antarcticus TaxID=34086 RepID=A0A081PEZ0_9SPHI|nr:alpha-1,2-fucosyltransferase [Pedobacter antarcticus]KEQ29263.1 hypothetical protein N180_06875 [Pedobacter antarcticus 4BY]SFE75534.1 Glycosyl transferase family 11 [Pedobacter antarcticus]
MKVVKILGGLGNQMFQYAFYLALSHRYKSVKTDLSGYENYTLHNGFELTRVFGIHPPQASLFTVNLYSSHIRSWKYRKMRRVLMLKNTYKVEDIFFAFDKDILHNKKPMLYWGYWQNQEYFIDIEKKIRAEFRFKNPLNEDNSKYMQSIKSTTSVSVHIRRGDYLKDELLGGLCSLNYYKKAISKMSASLDAPVFYIFSDDLQWCKENLDLDDPKFYISGNDHNNSYIDMQLMSYCKHNIIANSSFSWWAAWLNENPNKIVIGPKKWTNNDDSNQIIPEQWIKL